MHDTYFTEHWDSPRKYTDAISIMFYSKTYNWLKLYPNISNKTQEKNNPLTISARKTTCCGRLKKMAMYICESATVKGYEGV